MADTFPWSGMSRHRYRRLVLPTNKQLVPIKQWAQETNFSVSGVLHQIGRGELEGYKISGRWYVLRQ